MSSAIQLPSSVKIRRIQWTLERPAQVHRSSYTGRRTVVANPWHGQWTANMEIQPVVGEANVRNFRAFLAKLKGQINTFRVPATEGAQNSRQGVYVSTAASAGATTIRVTGPTLVSSDLKAGQFVTIRDQLLQLTRDAVSAPSSAVGLTFEPPLRNSVEVGDYVNVSNPTALLHLASANVGWAVDPGQLYGAQLEGEEAIQTPPGYANFDFSTLSLDSRITMTRASTGTRFNPSTGTMEVIAINTPRFDYDPSTLAFRGLLVENTRTNLYTNSGNSNGTVGVVGSGGVLPTGWSIVASMGLTVQVMAVNVDTGIGGCRIRINGTPTSTGTFRLQTNAAATLTVGVSVAQSQFIRGTSGSLTNVTNVLFTPVNVNNGTSFDPFTNNARLAAGRRYATGTVTSASVRPEIRFNVTNGQAVDMTLEIGGAQLEQNTYSSSYIPTTSASVTRERDIVYVGGTGFDDMYNPGETSLVIEAASQCTDTTLTVVAGGPGNSGTNGYVIQVSALSSAWQMLVRDASTIGSSSEQAGGGVASSYSAFTLTKSAAAFRQDDMAISVEGSAVTSDVSGTLPAGANINRIELGVSGGSSNYLNGWIKSFKYYGQRLPDAELVALSGA